jgi:hypothetical protein
MGKWFELYWNIEATKNKANYGQQVENYGWNTWNNEFEHNLLNFSM